MDGDLLGAKLMRRKFLLESGHRIKGYRVGVPAGFKNPGAVEKWGGGGLFRG